MNVLLMFGDCVGERVSLLLVLRYGSCILVKTTSFCLFRTRFEVGLESEGVRERKHEESVAPWCRGYHYCTTSFN